MAEVPTQLRLQVYLARAGLGSRRSCEELIRQNRVRVNGRIAELGSKVDPDNDDVAVDDRSINLKQTDWLLLHKPRGYVTTRDDPSGRKTIYDLLPGDLHHLFHVGRLDRDSSGALLLTNDGKAANRLLHPRYATDKVYRVDVNEEPGPDVLDRLLDGVPLEDGNAAAAAVEYLGEARPGVFRLLITLEEGRNREVRRMMEAVGFPVYRLFRVRFGPISIGKLAVGRWRRLTREEVQSLHG